MPFCYNNFINSITKAKLVMMILCLYIICVIIVISGYKMNANTTKLLIERLADKNIKLAEKRIECLGDTLKDFNNIKLNKPHETSRYILSFKNFKHYINSTRDEGQLAHCNIIPIYLHYYQQQTDTLNYILNSGLTGYEIDKMKYITESNLKKIHKDSKNRVIPYFWRPEYEYMTINARDIKADIDDKLGKINTSYVEHNIYHEASEILRDIQDKDNILQSIESDKLKATAMEIFNLYVSVHDESFKNQTISQLAIIDKHMTELIDGAMIPGSQSYIKNEIKIKQHYLNSIIEQPSIITISKPPKII